MIRDDGTCSNCKQKVDQQPREYCQFCEVHVLRAKCEKLTHALNDVHDVVFANSIHLGSEDYFKVRGIIADTLTATGGWRRKTDGPIHPLDRS